jgi:hypothetical protein
MGVVLAAAVPARATVPPPAWQVRPFLADSATLPVMGGGLIVEVSGDAGPVVPADLAALSVTERDDLVADVAAFGELEIVDEELVPRDVRLEVRGGLLWLAFEPPLEPGRFVFRSRAYSGDVSAIAETTFEVTPARTPPPEAAGTIEVSVECDEGAFEDTTRDARHRARLAHSGVADYASIALHRWSLLAPMESGETWHVGAWQPGGFESTWTRSCSPGYSYGGQLAEGSYPIRLETRLAHDGSELAPVEATLVVSCEACGWRSDDVPPDPGAPDPPGDNGAGPRKPSKNCAVAAPGAESGGPALAWFLLAFVALRRSTSRRRSRPFTAAR